MYFIEPPTASRPWSSGEGDLLGKEGGHFLPDWWLFVGRGDIDKMMVLQEYHLVRDEAVDGDREPPSAASQCLLPSDSRSRGSSCPPTCPFIARRHVNGYLYRTPGMAIWALSNMILILSGTHVSEEDGPCTVANLVSLLGMENRSVSSPGGVDRHAVPSLPPR